ncbi:hypothetical protein BJ165DRAFT_1385695 [Panaeolus papilionaceus]|nr:hypothetical protein BJ165DRAFT_1385695 [Panaeolus papilionaceus]
MNPYITKRMSYPRSWRFVDGQGEEACVRLVGIICCKDLPPFKGQRKMQVACLRQHIKLTGFGTEAFDEIVWAKVVELQRTLDDEMHNNGQHGGHDELEMMEHSQWEGDTVLDMHSRHFTYRNQVPNQKHIPFANDVDPNHFLEDAKGPDLVHAEDNVVNYFRKIYDEDSKPHYTRENPERFKIGDVVGRTISLVGYPLAKAGGPQRYQMRLVLRGIALISSEGR